MDSKTNPEEEQDEPISWANGQPPNISWKFLMYMKLGQSAHFDRIPTHDDAKKLARRASVAARAWALRTDFKFKTAMRKKRSGWSVGIWRVE